MAERKGTDRKGMMPDDLCEVGLRFGAWRRVWGGPYPQDLKERKEMVLLGMMEKKGIRTTK